jgi:hypothetical protein
MNVRDAGMILLDTLDAGSRRVIRDALRALPAADAATVLNNTIVDVVISKLTPSTGRDMHVVDDIMGLLQLGARPNPHGEAKTLTNLVDCLDPDYLVLVLELMCPLLQQESIVAEFRRSLARVSDSDFLSALSTLLDFCTSVPMDVFAGHIPFASVAADDFYAKAFKKLTYTNEDFRNLRDGDAYDIDIRGRLLAALVGKESTSGLIAQPVESGGGGVGSSAGAGGSGSGSGSGSGLGDKPHGPIYKDRQPFADPGADQLVYRLMLNLSPLIDESESA